MLVAICLLNWWQEGAKNHRTPALLMAFALALCVQQASHLHQTAKPSTAQQADALCITQSATLSKPQMVSLGTLVQWQLQTVTDALCLCRCRAMSEQM